MQPVVARLFGKDFCYSPSTLASQRRVSHLSWGSTASGSKSAARQKLTGSHGLPCRILSFGFATVSLEGTQLADFAKLVGVADASHAPATNRACQAAGFAIEANGHEGVPCRSLVRIQARIPNTRRNMLIMPAMQWLFFRSLDTGP